MIYFIIGAIVLGVLIYLGTKGNADLRNVEKFGGLRSKYKILIDKITARNPYYQVIEKNANNVVLSCTGMVFQLIEMDKKLQVTWKWERFASGKVYKRVWNFEEGINQDKMYNEIKYGIAIQNIIDDGMTEQQAIDFYPITQAKTEPEAEKLINIFSQKYPQLWQQMQQ